MASLIPFLAQFLAQPALWLALILAAVGLGLLAWRLRLRWRPAWLLRVLLVALTLLALFWSQWGRFDPQPTPQHQVMVVDQSDSLSAETRQSALEQAAQWQAAGTSTQAAGAQGAGQGSDNRSIVIFGSEAQPLLLQKGGFEAGIPEDSAAPTEAVLPTSQAAQPDDASVVQTVQAGLPRIDGRASNLVAALELANRLLGSSPGQVILLSDGLVSTTGEISAAVSQLSHQGHTLDTISLNPRPMEHDLALGSLIAPKNLWAGTPVDLVVPLMGEDGDQLSSAAPQLKLKINGQESQIAAEPVEQDTAASMPAAGIPVSGSAVSGRLYHFNIPSLPQGMVSLAVTSSPAAANPNDLQSADPFPGNNSAYAVLQVFPPPRLLLVTSQADSAAPGAAAVQRFSQALAQKQIQLETVTPDKLSTNLEMLQKYQVIFLDNLLSNQLSREQMTALQVFTSRLAGGVVFLGGRNSYTLGGYEGTPLEVMLPVQLKPPPRTQRPPMVFQLILDTSSSMGVGDSDRGLEPIDLAREAAMRSIETLQAEDYLGVLTFADEPQWQIPLRSLGGTEGLRQALLAVSQVNADGTTYMFSAMQEALNQMAKLPADAPQSRHILLLSDGQSSDGSLQEFKDLATAAHSRGITISTIALGEGADEDVMKAIAEAGKGRFYSVKDASNLPRILVAESKAARSENVQSGQTSLKAPEGGHPVLSGIRPDQLPVLTGYNALQSKSEQGAEDILVSTSFGDPILSAWQYGLGRVAAWTGDLGEEWTSNWQPDSEGAFWAQVVRYMLVDPAQSPAQATVQVEPTRLLVDAAINTPDGTPVNLAEVKFSFAGADNQTTTYRLTQKSAGVYGAEIPRPPDGAYRAVLSYPSENGQTIEVPAPFAVNPPQEWLPQDPAAGLTNLTAWAMSAGGKTTTLQALLAGDAAASKKQSSPFDDFGWVLLMALVILWPLEIAVRRRWLPWME